MAFSKVKMPSLGNIKFGRWNTSSQTTIHERKEASSQIREVGNHQPDGFRPVPISDEGSAHLDKELVKWGVYWYKYPLLIFLVYCVGTCAAVGHHYYYLWLSGTMPLNDFQQRTVVILGNIFSFIAIFLWRVSCTMSYKQYIWITVKNKSLKVSTLDRIFALTSDPRGFLSWEVWTRTKMLSFMAAIAW